MVGHVVPHHGLGIHAEADVIKAHGFDQGNVVRRDPGFEMLFGVALGIVDLRKPLTEVDAMAKVCGAALGKRRVGLSNRGNREEQGE